MKKLYVVSRKQQQGAVTLFTSVILIIAITLVTFLTAKTVLQETKMTANNYRASQAVAEAEAAMDYAITYFNNGGFDQDGDEIIDDVDAGGVTFSPPGVTFSPPGTSTVVLSAGACAPVLSAKTALITATGTSDDGVANRSISQCVGTINIFSDEGPQQPLIARGGVGLTGNFKVVNRVNNTTVWSGDSVNLGNSASAATYIWDHTQVRPDATDIANRDTFEDTSNPIVDVDIVSTEDLGLGVDIYIDETLGGLTGDGLFEGFFPAGDSLSGRDKMQSLASGIGQLVGAASIGSLDGKDGVMWVNGDANDNVAMTGGDYGSSDKPVALIINGNLNVSGNPTIYGVLYVVGQVDATGTLSVIGSTIVEGTNNSSFLAGEKPVVGSGGVDLTYSPFTQQLSANPLKGTGTVISGSWRDW